MAAFRRALSTLLFAALAAPVTAAAPTPDGRISGAVIDVAGRAVTGVKEGSIDVNHLVAQLPEPPPVRPEGRRRTSARTILKGQPTPSALSDLHEILRPGHEVVILGRTGRRARGRLSAITGDRLTLYQEGSTLFLRRIHPARNTVFDGETIERIEIVDSSWNGGLIGAAIGAAAMFGIHTWEDAVVPDTNNMKGTATVLFGSVAFVTAIAVAQAIDLHRNVPVYQRSEAGARLEVAPVIGPGAAGIAMRLRF